jgi:hypothetical protein
MPPGASRGEGEERGMHDLADVWAVLLKVPVCTQPLNSRT